MRGTVLRIGRAYARSYATAQLPKISADRLWDSIHESCQWGAFGDGGGMNRLSLNNDDKKVREWFRSQAEELGCKVKVDEMGNMFAVYGSGNSPPIAIGSHLDTQPAGGRYDGILGVLSGLEAIRAIKENGYKPKNSLAVINWTNEEGARFPMSMCASGVYSGKVPLDTVHNLQDANGVSMRTELERIGFLGPERASAKSNPIAAHFELHIEQGPLLESTGKDIGIVRGVQGMRWFTIDIAGKESHTGTTPMSHRADSLLASAHMMVASNKISRSLNGLASTGFIVSSPQSVNTIPGNVKFTLDLRHPEASSLDEMEGSCFHAFRQIAKDHGVEIDISTNTQSPPIKFNAQTIDCVREAAREVVGDSFMDVTSGACHDSVYTSYVCPTSMVFVPCRGGISHSPLEHITKEQASKGAQVLMTAMLKYDAMS